MLSAFKSRWKHEEVELYDATRNFNSALAAAREARGEPDHGIARTVWKTENLAKSNRSRFTAIGLSTAVLATGVLFLTRKR